jgi:DedD protein
MAFFKFRKSGDDSPAAAPQAESVEALRRRARHRLIGAGVLVLLGVVGFPLLFDTQPRPISVDIPIDIPDRNGAKPLPAPVAAPKGPAASGIASPVAAAKPASASVAAPAPATNSAPVAAAEAKPEPKPEPKAEAKPAPAATQAAEARPANTPAAAAAPAAKPTTTTTTTTTTTAKAEPSDRTPSPTVATRAQPSESRSPAADEAGRFVVQVGAFSDVVKARETRQKVEKAGLKTYTHVAETKEGRRIRVRVGPFATRAEADKAAGRIKELELPAAILTL